MASSKNLPYNSMVSFKNLPYNSIASSENLPYNSIASSENIPYNSMASSENLPYNSMASSESCFSLSSCWGRPSSRNICSELRSRSASCGVWQTLAWWRRFIIRALPSLTHLLDWGAEVRHLTIFILQIDVVDSAGKQNRSETDILLFSLFKLM